MNGVNLRNEALRLMTLPVENKEDKDRAFPPAMTREEIDSNNLSTDDLTSRIVKTMKRKLSKL